MATFSHLCIPVRALTKVGRVWKDEMPALAERIELHAPESYTALTKNYYKDASTLIKHPAV